MPTTRPTAVAGSFYPSEPDALRGAINRYLAEVAPLPEARPKALIVPHAGYIYSGPVAATAYATLLPYRNEINRVVLLGPSHRVAFAGLATPDAERFATPLGEISLDGEMLARLEELPQVHRLAQAHQLEHSLEVQLPFLQCVLQRFALIPLVVGDATRAEVAEVIEMAWGDERTLLVVSSDLSHYHDYTLAQRLDQASSEVIVGLQPELLGEQAACGRGAIRGLLSEARARGMAVELLDLRNSGDTAGGYDRVVGYGSFLFH